MGGQSEKDQPQAQQSETGDGQSHDCAAVEGHQQGFSGAVIPRCCGRADIGFGGRLHPDQAGQRGGQRAHQERYAGAKAVLHGEQHRNHQCEDADLGVLRPQIGHGAQVNFVGDCDHERIAAGLLDDPPVQHRGGD